jgi:hypothetical protein
LQDHVFETVTGYEVMVLAHGYGSLRTIVSDTIAKIEFHVIVRFEIKSLPKTFAKRAIHDKIICAVVNVVDECCIVED